MIPDNLRDYYKLHAKIYDISRWAFLFGRNSASSYFPELPQHTSILDFGCGTGLQLQALKKKYPDAEITGIDQSSDMLNIARKKVPDVAIRNEVYSSESFANDSFDLIVASYSLSMVDDLDSILITFKKHLKPNGSVLVIDFDSTPFRWFNHWMDINHVHFDDQLFNCLEQSFQVNTKVTKQAYFGLYAYSLFVGQN